MSSIIPVVPLSGSISGTGKLSGTLEGKPAVISGEISSYRLSHTKYSGPYEVIPRKVDQTLETSDKLLTDDVTINAINYSQVDNPSGGLTVNIGYE